MDIRKTNLYNMIQLTDTQVKEIEQTLQEMPIKTMGLVQQIFTILREAKDETDKKKKKD